MIPSFCASNNWDPGRTSKIFRRHLRSQTRRPHKNVDCYESQYHCETENDCYSSITFDGKTGKVKHAVGQPKQQRDENFTGATKSSAGVTKSSAGDYICEDVGGGRQRRAASKPGTAGPSSFALLSLYISRLGTYSAANITSRIGEIRRSQSHTHGARRRPVANRTGRKSYRTTTTTTTTAAAVLSYKYILNRSFCTINISTIELCDSDDDKTKKKINYTESTVYVRNSHREIINFLYGYDPHQEVRFAYSSRSKRPGGDLKITSQDRFHIK
ncbi:unnamed protein product [Trichogramma brassicae]|uniref:Uncharacterized protein n=1 Tax=Trichogramma brassicae TaxID=86971 RepID=A0A6H5I9F9_9HYME|nr:unnamed protein product [Trichogramma brassicae]